MTNSETTDRVAFWLLPADDERKHLQAIVKKLSSRYNTPRFEPHLTLLPLPAPTVADATAVLDKLASACKPLELFRTGPPRWSPVYNQALILPFELSAGLAELVRILHPQQIVPTGYLPHISLMYANLDEESGPGLAEEIFFDRRTVNFDRCAALRIGPQCQSDEDVRAWQPIATVRLGTNNR